MTYTAIVKPHKLAFVGFIKEVPAATAQGLSEHEVRWKLIKALRLTKKGGDNGV